VIRLSTTRPIKNVKPKLFKTVDGDTLQFIFSCRLNRIDAPETKGIEKQLGQIAKNWLVAKMEGATEVKMDIVDRDYYGRLLIELYVDGYNINDMLVELKLAELYKPKNHNNGVLDI
jgi:endonuclease YncB( thermonuclease family)